MNSVLVVIQGRDPKRAKASKYPFHSLKDGLLTTSTSGVLFCNQSKENYSSGIVFTIQSFLSPFLKRNNGEQVELIQGTKVSIHLQSQDNDKSSSPYQYAATVIALADIPHAEITILEPFSASSDWQIGWGNQKLELRDSKSENASQLNKLPRWIVEKMGSDGLKAGATQSSNSEEMKNGSSLQPFSSRIRIAVLEVEIPSNLTLQCSETTLESPLVGEALTVVGSPFGLLSPRHFFNFITSGIVANQAFSPGDRESSILFADMKCLPGMEGGPAYNSKKQLFGMLIPPLCHISTGVEIPMILSFRAILKALGGTIDRMPFILEHFPSLANQNIALQPALAHSSATSAFETVKESIVLISVNNSMWGSGIVISSNGHILTNAHLVDPLWNSKILLPRSHTKKIEVRMLDRTRKGFQWQLADLVFVSKGALDIALIRVKDKAMVQPIAVETAVPKVGSRILAIGHGLFGPRFDLLPSATQGIVSRVLFYEEQGGSSSGADSLGTQPGMIMTTAAIYSGCSGGALVNEGGKLVGLITRLVVLAHVFQKRNPRSLHLFLAWFWFPGSSNVKHKGQRVIPILNFSIPCKAMEPAFRFCDSGLLEELETLNGANPQLSQVWSLASIKSHGTVNAEAEIITSNDQVASKL